ncbi:hypothetical protein S83_052054, partial [Arachis hypogaea]
FVWQEEPRRQALLRENCDLYGTCFSVSRVVSLIEHHGLGIGLGRKVTRGK